VVGTDYPFFPREAPATKTLRQMGLRDREVWEIESRNARRFLGIES
jgi:hypothetical protein